MRKDSAGGGAAGRTRNCTAGLLVWTCLGAVTGCAVQLCPAAGGGTYTGAELPSPSLAPRPARHLLEGTSAHFRPNPLIYFVVCTCTLELPRGQASRLLREPIAIG